MPLCRASYSINSTLSDAANINQPSTNRENPFTKVYTFSKNSSQRISCVKNNSKARLTVA